MKSAKLDMVIFDTHPVQYRVQIYAKIQSALPGRSVVLYGNNSSVSGYKDKEFGIDLKWDIPLTDGYQYRFLSEEPSSSSGRSFFDIDYEGISAVLEEFRPRVILLHSLNFILFWRAYFWAKRHGVKVWLRVETQDHAFSRGRLKGMLRDILWGLSYSLIDTAFYFGKLNREHLVRHGISERRLRWSPFATADKTKDYSVNQKAAIRAELRRELGVAENAVVVGFFGKLIEKKNPTAVLTAISYNKRKEEYFFMCVGAGKLKDNLIQQARELNIASHFAGFINQSQLMPYYLATDIFVLPSRQSGEVWGLVVNEALQAGCAVVVTDAVGCYPEFDDLDRFRVVPVGDDQALSKAIEELSQFPRSFDWASARMEEYSIETAAEAIIAELKVGQL